MHPHNVGTRIDTGFQILGWLMGHHVKGIEKRETTGWSGFRSTIMHPHPAPTPLYMPIKRGNPDQFLQKVGGTYYARVRVPRTLEKYTGQTHIRRTL